MIITTSIEMTNVEMLELILESQKVFGINGNIRYKTDDYIVTKYKNNYRITGNLKLKEVER